MMASVAGASGASTSGAKGGSGSLACDLSGKYFQGVLNGLMRGFVLREEGISLDFIRDSLFTASSMPPADIGTLLQSMLQVVTQCARENWTLTQLRTRLADSDLSTDLQSSWVDFWRGQQSKVHAALVDAATWTDAVKRIAWRVDVVTSSKRTEDVTEPVAIMELRTGARSGASGNGASGAAGGDAVVFEMNRAELGGVLSEVADIEAAIRRIKGEQG